MEQTQESPTETQEPQELESPTEEEQQLWGSKIEPLLSTFRTACQDYLILGTDVAIEEIIWYDFMVGQVILVRCQTSP